MVSHSISSIQAQVLDIAWKDIVTQKEDIWYASEEAQRIAENVILYQSDIGGWPKNIQMHKSISPQEEKELIAIKSQAKNITTDNGATTQEMLYLSKVFNYRPDERYKEAFLKGLEYLLEAQYDNGGWPQFYPIRKGYYSHITYNDNSMVNIMTLLQHIIKGSSYYSIKPNQNLIDRAAVAFNKGINCILKTQYRQSGQLTAWCAQHDTETLAPAKARSYELPSLSGSESCDIIELLMSMENPSIEVKNAVIAAADWLEKVKIQGLRKVVTYNEQGQAINKIVFKDASAPPLWARFMELDDNQPFFCDRDGIKKTSIAEIGKERRNGYKWYTTQASQTLQKYSTWRRKHFSSKDHIKNKSKDLSYIVVSKDGSGDFTSIQAAINNCKAFPYQRITIFIKNGTYHEKVKIHEWNTNLTLKGESKEKTIITYDDYFNKIDKGRNSTFHSYTVLVEADNFIAQNLTIENSAGRVGQAVALSVTSTKVKIENCRLLGNQDTLYASGIGKQYYLNCYIEGTTDFIFGSATAYFEQCYIHSKKDSYITAASTPKGAEYGYVFYKCTLTSDNDISKVYLGRPWRKYAQTVFLECTMGNHILPEGWHNWSKQEAENTTLYAEYKNNGPGYSPKKRVAWSHQLKKAKKYTIQRVLSGKSETINKNWYDTL